MAVPGIAGTLTAVGASLEGHRIAFTASGKGGGLYVATLSLDGGALTVGPAHRLPTSLKVATAVDWMSEDSLVVAGIRANTQAGVYSVAVDGTEETDLQYVGDRVSHVVGYPNGRVMAAEADGTAWEYRFSRFEPIRPGQVGGGAGTSTPTSPFFLH